MESGDSVKVMSFNVRSDSMLDGKNRWKHRKTHVISLLNDFKGDIIGLQEVTPKMLEDLKQEMSAYHIIGSARTKRYFAEHNNLLISKRHHVLEHDTFWLSNQPKKVGSSIWFSLFPRICTTAKVQLESGEIVRVYNTHLDVYLSPARKYGLKKIMTYIQKQYERDQLPVILMGDFNTLPHQSLIQTIRSGQVSDKRFVAVQEQDATLYQQATMGRFKDRTRGMHLDYIFVSDECTVMHVEILKTSYNGCFPSDHYPIWAEVTIQTT